MSLFPNRFLALYSAFKNRNYAIYTVCSVISLIGTWIQRLAVAWLTWQLTESELWLGVVACAGLLPTVIIGPIAGVWADRFERKRLAKLCQVLMLLQALALFILFKLDLLSIYLLFVLTLINGVFSAVYQPIRLALVPALVEKKDLVAAISFSAVSFNAARFIGPAVAGIIISQYDMGMAFLVNALSYLSMLVAWFYIKVPPQKPQEEVPPSVLADLAEGVKYVFRKSTIAYLLALQLIVALFARPIGMLMPAFTTDIFGSGPETLALFTSALGVGAVFAGLGLSSRSGIKGLVDRIFIDMALVCFGILLFFFGQQVWLSTVGIFIAGYAMTACTVASQTLIQSYVEEDMRGRVMSLWVAIVRGAPALGALLLGWISNIYGLLWPNVLASTCCLIAILVIYPKKLEMKAFFKRFVKSSVAEQM